MVRIICKRCVCVCAALGATGAKLDNFTVSLSNISPEVQSPRDSGWLCGRGPAYASVLVPIEVDCPVGCATARYVSIIVWSSATDAMTLCEVMVYGVYL